MARVEIKSSIETFVSSTSDLPVLKSPLPKRSKLSLRRNSPLYNGSRVPEDDLTSLKMPNLNTEVSPEAATSKPDIEMIDLTCDTQEENTPENGNTTELKPSVSEAETEDDKIKVWTIGLPNCGNTCFVNSILQVLRYSPNFLNSLHSLAVKCQVLKDSSDDEDDSHEVTFFRHMHTLYTIMKKKELLMSKNVDKDYSSTLIRPVKLVINSLREVTSLFEEGEQHDAHELFITIMASYEKACEIFKKQLPNPEDDAVNKETNCLQKLEIKESEPQSVVSPVEHRIKRSLLAGKRRRTKSLPADMSFIESLVLGMEGKIRHVVKCLECEKRLEREETFANLEVTIPEEISSGESVDLRQCLSQKTKLCGENKFYCETCEHHNEAEMSSEIVSIPPILLLHFGWMGRFSVMSMEKTSIKVIIPLSLDTSENREIFTCSQGENYKLYAVVLHIGRSTSGGHYVCFIKDASSQDSMEQTKEEEAVKSPARQNKQVGSSKYCCVTEEIMNFTGVDSYTKWLLFDDDIVSPVVIDEDSDSFPYFNFLSITASPCMIFYHKT